MASSSLHIVKTESAPQLLWQPRRNGGRNHSQHSHLHPFALQYLIRRQIRFIGFCIYDICAQYGELALTHPAVVNGMSRLHVVITHVAQVVTQVVQHRSAYMLSLGIYIIIVIRYGLALQYISVIYQHKRIFIL